MAPPPAAGVPGLAARIVILLACAAGLGGLAVLPFHQHSLPHLVPLALYFFWDAGESLLPLAAIPAFFLVWSIPQFCGKPGLSILSILMAAALTLLVAVHFVLAWEGGVKFEGLEYTVFQALMKAVLAATAWFTARRLRKQPSWAGTVAWHAGLVSWLTLFAFPYLGETP